MELVATPQIELLGSSSTVKRARSRGLDRSKVWAGLALGLVLAFGTFARAYPSSGFTGIGYDEHAYAVFVREIQVVGLWNYGAVVRVYVDRQNRVPDAEVPATRAGYLIPGAVAANVFHLDPLRALKLVSMLASLLTLGVTAVIGYRLGGTTRMLVLTALMAAAPLQIALAQRALVDSWFACWAILTAWFFWESLQAPEKRGWLAAYGASLFVLVLTKENAAFVFAALMGTGATLCAFTRRRPSLGLVLVSVVAPAGAVLFLASLMGGLAEWIAFYRMFSAKSATMHYAMQQQDGAWYRYLIDFAVLSPLVLALACGRVFQLERSARVDLFWALFLGLSFVIMSSVPFGMSLRFASYWDLPLRWLAASQLILLAPRVFPRRSLLALTLAVVLCSAVDWSQYGRFFIRGRIYDPVSAQLLHASDLVK